MELENILDSLRDISGELNTPSARQVKMRMIADKLYTVQKKDFFIRLSTIAELYDRGCRVDDAMPLLSPLVDYPDLDPRFVDLTLGAFYMFETKGKNRIMGDVIVEVYKEKHAGLMVLNDLK